MQISDFLQPGNIVLGLSVPSKERLLQALAARAGASLQRAEAAILTALVNREKLGSTGMGQGIAIPHATLVDIDMPFGLLALLARPVDFDAVDDAPVDVVFLLLNPASRPSAGLAALSAVARALRDPATLRTLRSSSDPAEVFAALASAYSISRAAPPRG